MPPRGYATVSLLNQGTTQRVVIVFFLGGACLPKMDLKVVLYKSSSASDHQIGCYRDRKRRYHQESSADQLSLFGW